MKYFLIAMLWASPLWAFEEDPNWYIKHCRNEVGFDQSQDWNKLSACTNKFVNARQAEKYEELRAFLEANPRYRFPGQSLNRCWGKPREMAFERSTVSVGPQGMQASVWYKDKLPAGCFEQYGWDNRDD